MLPNRPILQFWFEMSWQTHKFYHFQLNSTNLVGNMWAKRKLPFWSEMWSNSTNMVRTVAKLTNSSYGLVQNFYSKIYICYYILFTIHLINGILFQQKITPNWLSLHQIPKRTLVQIKNDLKIEFSKTKLPKKHKFIKVVPFAWYPFEMFMKVGVVCLNIFRLIVESWRTRTKCCNGRYNRATS